MKNIILVGFLFLKIADMYSFIMSYFKPNKLFPEIN